MPPPPPLAGKADDDDADGRRWRGVLVDGASDLSSPAAWVSVRSHRERARQSRRTSVAYPFLDSSIGAASHRNMLLGGGYR